MTRLDQLRALLGKGKKAEAKKGLEDLIKKFPKSDAADEARDLLEEIK
jgi:TolA-binding protein